jgi:hypothetical protein
VSMLLGSVLRIDISRCSDTEGMLGSLSNNRSLTPTCKFVAGVNGSEQVALLYCGVSITLLVYVPLCNDADVTVSCRLAQKPHSSSSS